MKKRAGLLVMAALLPVAGGSGSIFSGGHSDGYDSHEITTIEPTIFRGGHSDGYGGFDATVTPVLEYRGVVFSIK